MRFRGFEFEDQPWLAQIIRDSMTNYLRFQFQTFNLYKPVMPILKDALNRSGSLHILDLCSCKGGMVQKDCRYFKKILLTRKRDVMPEGLVLNKTLAQPC